MDESDRLRMKEAKYFARLDLNVLERQARIDERLQEEAVIREKLAFARRLAEAYVDSVCTEDGCTLDGQHYGAADVAIVLAEALATAARK